MRHLRLYRAISAIHRTGSIRSAAADLAISPSALNRSIQAFEEELSFTVFDRMPGGVRLSEAGQLLLDVIDRHLIEFGELQAQLGTLRDGEGGTLRISLGSDIDAGVVPDCVAELEGRFRNLAVEIVQDDTVESLLARRVHLALLTNPVTLDATEVLYAHSCALAIWQHPEEAAEPAPDGLWAVSDRGICLPPEGTGARIAIEHLLRKTRTELRRVTTTTAARATEALRRPGALALLPEIAVATGASDSALRRLPIPAGQVQLCALRLARLPMIRPAQVFLTTLQKRLEGG